jgi:DNA mismatch repair protein MutS
MEYPTTSAMAGRPAAQAEKQLSLVADLGIQSDLFAAESLATGAESTDRAGNGEGNLTAEALRADACSRPRRPREEHAPQAPPQPEDKHPETMGEPARHAGDDDLPPWHHHSLVDRAALTPALRHYVELKAAHPERVLLYRLGDFYECFFEDAITLSRLLELTLTGKEAGKTIGRVPMAGIPHHAAERYCGELVRRGLSVALCDQLESTPAKGALLRRGITRVLTPGTVLEEGMLAARRNNWLCAVVLERGRWGLAVADVSTGEFRLTEREGSDALHQELLQLEAAEVVWPEPPGPPTAATLQATSWSNPEESLAHHPCWCPEGMRLSPVARTPFEAPAAQALLLRRFRLTSLDGLGLGETPLATRAAGGLLAYLDATQPGAQPGGDPQSQDPRDRAAGVPGAAPAAGPAAVSTPPPVIVPLERPRLWHAGDHLVLDAQTRRNLELTRTQIGGDLHGSLLWALDRTVTAMGGRCLRRWIEAPLVDLSAIVTRQEAVGELVEQRPLRLALRRLLRPMGDLERLAGRSGAGTASARDLVALADGLERLPLLAGLLRSCHSAPLLALRGPWPELMLPWQAACATGWWKLRRSPSAKGA